MVYPHQENVLQRGLLASGILAPLLYLLTDVMGGLRYEGYSFRSQMVSELMAKGSPSEAFVDPLFLLFDVLMFAFGLGVLREGIRRKRALRITGLLLSAYAVAGFTGPTLFEMSPRGTSVTGSDIPHIVVTGVIVLTTLFAVGVGAFTLGRRFRWYSFASLGVVIVFGALAAIGGRQMAAGEPTPGFGIVERVCIYSSMLWFAVLAAALVRRMRSPGLVSTRVLVRSAHDHTERAVPAAGHWTTARGRPAMSISTVGYWSGMVAFAASVSYSLVQILQVAGLLRFPADEILIYGTSLCIVVPFILEMLALHHLTPPGKQYWTHAALIFTVIYAVFVTANYVVQLATVVPAKLRGGTEAIRVLEQTPHSMFWDYDAVGYIAMGVACLLAVPAIGTIGFDRWVRRALIANALVTPLISVVYFYPSFSNTLLFMGFPWAITAPLFMLMVALMLRRRQGLGP